MRIAFFVNSIESETPGMRRQRWRWLQSAAIVVYVQQATSFACG
jgi:hypothetical protein